MTDSQENNQRVKGGWGGNSNTNYVRVYPQIAKELLKGNEVWINIVDFDYGEDPDKENKPVAKPYCRKCDQKIRSKIL